MNFLPDMAFKIIFCCLSDLSLLAATRKLVALHRATKRWRMTSQSIFKGLMNEK